MITSAVGPETDTPKKPGGPQLRSGLGQPGVRETGQVKPPRAPDIGVPPGVVLEEPQEAEPVRGPLFHGDAPGVPKGNEGPHVHERLEVGPQLPETHGLVALMVVTFRDVRLLKAQPRRPVDETVALGPPPPQAVDEAAGPSRRGHRPAPT